MYIIKNAYKSIIRAKGRNILIFILVFLIALSACVALSVRNSAESAKETAYNALSITAQISTDRQGIMGGGNTDREAMMDRLSQSLTLDELNYYAKSEYVDNFYYFMSAGLNVTEDFTVYETSSSGGFAGGFGGMRGGGRSMADLTVIGYSSHDAMTSFISGENVIYEGSVFEQDSSDNSCVISYELAVLNELAVGDTITVCNPSKEEQTYTLTVCGIFQNETTDSYSNTIFTTYASLDAIVGESGADHIQISNNTFIECNFGGRGDVITIESLLNGERVQNTPLAEIRVTDNQFASCYQEVINADNVNGLTIENNIIRDCENYIIGEHCKNVKTESNALVSKGDVNADGEFNVADVVALQKWIICAKDAEKSIVEWKAGNFVDDDRLDVFDLVIMKRELLKNN